MAEEEFLSSRNEFKNEMISGERFFREAQAGGASLKKHEPSCVLVTYVLCYLYCFSSFQSSPFALPEAHRTLCSLPGACGAGNCANGACAGGGPPKAPHRGEAEAERKNSQENSLISKSSRLVGP